MRAKWSAPIRKYWKISEQMMVKYKQQRTDIQMLQRILYAHLKFQYDSEMLRFNQDIFLFYKLHLLRT